MKNMEVQTEDVNDECYTEDDIWKCYILAVKGVRTKKVDDRNQKGSTKYIILQIFSPLNAQEVLKFDFLKRAQIPHDFNTGLQIRDFWYDFS